MPVPTPPNKELFKVTPPKPKMRLDSKKLSDQIKKTTAELATSLDIPREVLTGEKILNAIDEAIEATKPPVKKIPFVPPEHLTQNPFRENDALRKLSYELKKETDNKKPVKRSPKRTPTNKTTGAK